MSKKMIFGLLIWASVISFCAWEWVERDFQTKKVNWEMYQYKLGVYECEKKGLTGGTKNETHE